jgi:hypothetical protein
MTLHSRDVLASAAIASGTSVSVLDDTHDSPVLITTPSQSHSAVEDLDCELKEEKRKNDLLHQRIQALTAVKEKSLRKKQKLSQISTGMSNSVSDAKHPDVVDLPDSSRNNQRLSTLTVDLYLEGSSEKEHYCFYCFKRIIKMARHLTLCHRIEDEVVRSCYCQRNQMNGVKFERIMCAGDFCHIQEVLRSGSGQLIVLRRPTIEECSVRSTTAENYVLCPGCLGFLVKGDLWRHARKCRAVGDDARQERGNVLSASCLLMFPVLSSANEDFIEGVVAFMKQDDVTTVASKDWLIIRLGMYMFQQHGLSQKHLIRNICAS